MDVTILVRTYNSGDLYNEYKALDVPLLFMPLGYLNIGRWWNYYSFYKRNGFDTICDFNANMAGIPVWLAYLAGIKNRITFYRQGKDHFRTSFLKRTYNKLMNRLVYRYSTKILANSQSAINFFFSYRKTCDSRFKVIKNGIDFNLFRKKINKAQSDLDLIKSAYMNDLNNGTDDTSPTFKAFEEGSETMSKEANSQLAIRQEKFIRDLKNALFRVENKTYGVCKVTGKLISKERLMIVPHATMSIEAKNMQR